MTAPIGPGDLVECIDNSRRGYQEWEPGAQPALGAIYTVADLFLNPLDEPVVELCEIRRGALAEVWWGGRVGYALDRFVPVRRPNIEILKSLLAPSPERATEDA